MENETIHLELNADENRALAKALLARMEYLAEQPRSPERDAEFYWTDSIVRKALPQTVQRANVERAQRRAQLN